MGRKGNLCTAKLTVVEASCNQIEPRGSSGELHGVIYYYCLC